jgi:hypothetical protein
MKWLVLGFLLMVGCQKSTHPPLTVEAYVWQKPDRPEVREAIDGSAGVASKLHIRAAEMKWTGGRFATQRFLNKLPAPHCGLVVRIGSSAAQLEWTPEQIEAVAKIIREFARLGPSEIQCDYDCPQKRLGSYRSLLDALQIGAGSVPVLPTALPSWLGEPDFKNLIKNRSGYVLQVHSLQLPKRKGEPVLVFNPDTARAAARRAAEFHIPFRIAMATYGCEVRFGADGKVADVISEDLTAPSTLERVYALADPVASARLVREWTLDPPEGMQGIIWYRLPVGSDRRNWPWQTFQLVAHGETEPAAAELEATTGPGVKDLSIVNHGKFPVKLPGEIIITSPVVAADSVGAYRLEQRPEGLHFMIRTDVWPWLDPGKKIPTGWLRTADDSARIESSLKP